MKKLISVLCIISYASIVAGVAFIIFTVNNTNPLATYLFWIILPIIFILAIPAILNRITYVKDVKVKYITSIKKEISSRVWLTIYSVLLGVCVIAFIIFSRNHIKDIPYLVSENFTKTGELSISTIKRHSSKYFERELRVVVGNSELRIIENAFNPINSDEKYTFYFLPNTKWVMDITNEDGTSLLIK